MLGGVGGVGLHSGATHRRRVWASVGVVVSDVVAPALTLGLPGDGGRTPTGRALGEWQAVGEPVHLSLRQLVAHPPAWSAAGTLRDVEVSVCENPAVVQAASDALGLACAPLVCTAGWPSAAVDAVLEQVLAAGARLRHHGDLDWYGVAIHAALADQHGARPWRMTGVDYLARVRPDGPTLTGPPRDTPWDPALAAVMAERGVAVHEEQALDLLLADLRLVPGRVPTD